ncbi:MAG: sugar ABC transporter permease [Alphaproteobacteria bacterium]|nr:sugar ABC transporter permease [Alphaproteobacteria bacterium]
MLPRRGPPSLATLRPIHWVMVTPALSLLAVFLLLPSVYVAWLSGHASTYGQGAVFVGWQNYATIFADRAFWRALVNTVVVVHIVVYGELLLGLGLALLLAAPMRGKGMVIALLLAPYAITEASAMAMWRAMLEPDVGLINQALLGLGLEQIEWATERWTALLIASLVAIWHHLPFTFLILYSAVTTVPRELIEAAAIDGARPWQRFRHVTLWVIMPALLVAVLFRTIFAVRIFSEIWLLTEGGPARLTEVLSIYLYRATFKYHEFGSAAATGTIMLLLCMVVALPYLWRLYDRLVRHA